MEDRRPGYWAVIPADVRYDDRLPANAKLLYGEISALCDQRGYCYATNAYFSQLYGWSVATIQRLLSALSDRGYVAVDIIRNKRTREVEERRIYAGLQRGVTPPLKNEGRSPQKKGDPPLKNDFPIKEEQYKQYKENISPLSPQGGQPPVLYSMPLIDGTSYVVPQEKLDHWREMFPRLDIDQQIRSMIAWLEVSPERRKTRRGIGRFIVSWLSRRADKPPAKQAEGGGCLGKLEY